MSKPEAEPRSDSRIFGRLCGSSADVFQGCFPFGLFSLSLQVLDIEKQMPFAQWVHGIESPLNDIQASFLRLILSCPNRLRLQSTFLIYPHNVCGRRAQRLVGRGLRREDAEDGQGSTSERSVESSFTKSTACTAIHRLLTKANFVCVRAFTQMSISMFTIRTPPSSRVTLLPPYHPVTQSTFIISSLQLWHPLASQ